MHSLCSHKTVWLKIRERGRFQYWTPKDIWEQLPAPTAEKFPSRRPWGTGDNVQSLKLRSKMSRARYSISRFVCKSVCWSIRPSETNCSEHVTYGERPCFVSKCVWNGYWFEGNFILIIMLNKSTKKGKREGKKKGRKERTKGNSRNKLRILGFLGRKESKKVRRERR